MYITPFNFPYCASNDKSDINEDSTCFDCFLDPQWFPNCNFEDDTRKFLRKAQSHWGWDWGTGFLTSGIYRDVTPEIIDASAITDVKVETYPTDLDATPAGSSAATKPPSKFKITCTASIFSSSEHDLTLVASLALNSGASFTHKVTMTVAEGADEVELSFDVEVKNPKELWWPSAHCPATLHKLLVVIEGGGEDDSQRWAKKVGRSPARSEVTRSRTF